MKKPIFKDFQCLLRPKNFLFAFFVLGAQFARAETVVDDDQVHLATPSSVSFRSYRFSDEATGFEGSYSYGFKSGGHLGVAFSSEENQLDEKYKSGSLSLFGSKELSDTVSLMGSASRSGVKDHFYKQSLRSGIDYFLDQMILSGGGLFQRWDFQPAITNGSSQRISSVGWSARASFEHFYPFVLEVSRDQYLYSEKQVQDFDVTVLSDISNSEVYKIPQWIQSVRLAFHGKNFSAYLNTDESDQIADEEKFRSTTLGVQYSPSHQWSVDLDVSNQDYKSVGLTYFWY